MPSECPHCGADLPPKARVCRECGSDEQTGWSEDTQTADLGIPDENFDYNDYVEREFGTTKNSTGLKWYWVLVGLGLIGLMIFLALP